MKKLIILLFTVMLFASCAETEMFQVKNEQTGQVSIIKAKPYGWANASTVKIPGVTYQVCAGNVVWSILLFETVFAPVFLTGWSFYEPVSYNPDIIQPIK